MNKLEEQVAVVANLNVIDDVLFHKIAEDKGAMEDIHRIILQNPKLELAKSEAQRFLRNIGAHSVVLDSLSEDSNQSRIGCEVQKEDDTDHQRRVRFISSNIDTVLTEQGIDYDEIPDTYMIFISKFDVFKQSKTIYHIDRAISETGEVVDNGTHEIYVNTIVDDKSDIAELMQYFINSVGEHPKFARLCKRVNYFKEAQEGVLIMCKAVEDYARKYAEDYAHKYAEDYARKVANEKVRQEVMEGATNLLKDGVAVDIVAKAFKSLSRADVDGLNQKIANNEA